VLKFLNRFSQALDQAVVSGARSSARRFGRRSALARLGGFLVGGAVASALPFDRAFGAETKKAGPDDDTSCDYWRYCAVDGFLCSCCGGSLTQCPPGTEASKASWVGTCLNPNDGKQYLVSYNDCCGKTACGQCLCNNNERERPGYRLGVHNDINWCMANTSTMFHCTTSILVGVA